MAGEWIECALADACSSIDYGLTASASEHEAGPRFLRITDIVTGHIDWNAVPHVAADEVIAAKYRLHDGDIVLARTGASTGASAYVKNPPPAVFASYLVRLQAKPEFDARFLAYYLRSDDFWTFIRGVLGDKSAQPNASASTMTKAPLRAPKDKAEQRAIAHILGTLDDKIELNRRMSETLEAMARALFESWFVRFDPVRRNMARKGRGQPSPGLRPPSPAGRGVGGEGAKHEGEARRLHYRGGYEFSGLVEIARELRKKQTPAEAILWELIRDRRFLGLKFRRQHQLGDYIADFYCHEHRLVVELDGGVHAAKRKKDHKRDGWMEAQGFKVLRFQNEQLLDDPESVLAAIAQMIGPRENHPLPLGEGLGEDSVGGPHPLPLGEGWGEGSVEELDRLFPARLVDSELGEIPEGWEAGVLGDVLAQSVDRCTPSEETRSRPYVPIECIAARSLLLSESKPGEEAQSSLTRFRKGDLLFGAMRPYFHKVAIAPFDGTTRTTVFVLQPRQAEDFSFAALLLHDAKTIEYATNHSTGSTIPYAVWQGSLEEMPIVLPPDKVRRSFEQLARPLLTRIPPVFFENRTLAALRDALLPKLISGELRVKDADAFMERVAS